eukprot:COSAG03_NODE_15359_length_433_cov_0.886228_2_plen_69_part_01
MQSAGGAPESEREEPMCKYLSMSTQTILFPMPAYTYPHHCCLQHRGKVVRNPDTLAPTQDTSVPSPGHY